MNAGRAASDIGNFKKLIELDLACNQIEMLPSEIGNLTNIARLDLRSNNLTTLPIEIKNLEKAMYWDWSSILSCGDSTCWGVTGITFLCVLVVCGYLLLI